MYSVTFSKKKITWVYHETNKLNKSIFHRRAGHDLLGRPWQLQEAGGSGCQGIQGQRVGGRSEPEGGRRPGRHPRLWLVWGKSPKLTHTRLDNLYRSFCCFLGLNFVRFICGGVLLWLLLLDGHLELVWNIYTWFKSFVDTISKHFC